VSRAKRKEEEEKRRGMILYVCTYFASKYALFLSTEVLALLKVYKDIQALKMFAIREL
jgi:hypothetical protein